MGKCGSRGQEERQEELGRNHSLSYRAPQVARLRGSKSKLYFTLPLSPPSPLTLWPLTASQGRPPLSGGHPRPQPHRPPPQYNSILIAPLPPKLFQPSGEFAWFHFPLAHGTSLLVWGRRLDIYRDISNSTMVPSQKGNSSWIFTGQNRPGRHRCYPPSLHSLLSEATFTW